MNQKYKKGYIAHIFIEKWSIVYFTEKFLRFFTEKKLENDPVCIIYDTI